MVCDGSGWREFIAEDFLGIGEVESCLSGESFGSCLSALANVIPLKKLSHAAKIPGRGREDGRVGEQSSGCEEELPEAGEQAPGRAERAAQETRRGRL